MNTSVDENTHAHCEGCKEIFLQDDMYRLNDFDMGCPSCVFKCRDCSERYLNSFCSAKDVGICKWCSGEEN